MAWHDVTGEEALARQHSRAEGLSAQEAADRLARYGPNRLEVAAPTSVWSILAGQLKSVVVALLGVATIVAWITGERLNAAAILAVLVLNAALGFAIELKARRAMEALRALEVPRARVLRDGGIQEIDAPNLVPGDVIDLEAGRAVPADARLLAATELRCDEAALTGESQPVDKRAEVVLPEDMPLGDRVNMVYRSTAVVAGTGRAVVVATGPQTEVGRIGRLAGEVREQRTPLERRLDSLGRRLVWLALAIAAVVGVIGLLRGQPYALVLETGIALAIAAVPEGLPAVATIALAVGVARMARRRVLVRRLPQVETLGSTTVVCTDKTGTLTAGVMTVTTVWVHDEEIAVTGAGYAPEGALTRNGQAIDPKAVPALLEALRVGALCNRAQIQRKERHRAQRGGASQGGSGGIARAIADGMGGGPSRSPRDDDRWEAVGDPTEAALLSVAGKAGLDREALARDWPEVGEVPFSSERGWMATFHRAGSGTVAFVKGAPGRIVERSVRLLTPQGEVALDDRLRDAILERNRQLAGRGLRVLALARAAGAPGEEPRDLTFLALAGIEDPVAEGVPETIDRFRQAGIRTVMITGDQRLTAEAVARKLGILDGGEVIEGREFSRLDDAALASRLPRVAAFSRVSPEDKLRIVSGLQAAGEIVTMLGDGVNDAPALKKADLGVAMGLRGTDVAKEAAAVVLEDDRFPTLSVAVEEGRVIFDNIRKFVFYLFSCNLAEILVLLVAGIAGLPQPLLPLQILWLNLVTDTLPALSLAAEPAEPDVMTRPPRDPREAILSRGFLARIGVFAGLIAGATLAVFLLALRDGSRAEAVTMVFATLGLAQGFHLVNARSTSAVLRPAQILGNRWALAALAAVVVLQVVAVTFAPLARVLGLVRLEPAQWLLAGALALVPAVVGQAGRRMRETLSGSRAPRA